MCGLFFLPFERRYLIRHLPRLIAPPSVGHARPSWGAVPMLSRARFLALGPFAVKWCPWYRCPWPVVARPLAVGRGRPPAVRWSWSAARWSWSWSWSAARRPLVVGRGPWAVGRRPLVVGRGP
jgi:hypothetical protein